MLVSECSKKLKSLPQNFRIFNIMEINNMKDFLNLKNRRNRLTAKKVGEGYNDSFDHL